MPHPSCSAHAATTMLRRRCCTRSASLYDKKQRIPHAIEAGPMQWKWNFKRDLQEGRCNERDVQSRDNNHRTGLAKMSRSVPCSPSQGETEHSLEWQVSSSLRRRMASSSSSSNGSITALAAVGRRLGTKAHRRDRAGSDGLRRPSSGTARGSFKLQSGAASFDMDLCSVQVTSPPIIDST